MALGLLAAVPQQVYGQVISKKGTSSANFLLIPVGTRAAGLGGASTASVSDATAMYWNPGGSCRPSPDRAGGGAFAVDSRFAAYLCGPGDAGGRRGIWSECDCPDHG